LEFANAVPDFQHLKNGQRKHLMLEVSKQLIPESLQKSSNYGHFANTFQEILKMPFIEPGPGSMDISSLGWVSQEKIEAMFTKVQETSGQTLEIHGKDYRWMLPLVAAFSMEAWITNAQVDVSSSRF